MYPAILWHKENSLITCKLCNQKCKFEKKGFCNVRIFKKDKLYTKNYFVLQTEIKTIEEIPMFHFKPFSKTLEISSIGYNFSKSYKEVKNAKKISLKSILKLIKKNYVENVVFSFEPIIYFETFYKIVKFTFREGLNNIFSTNAYFPSQFSKLIGKYCNAALINIYSSLNFEYYKKELNVKNPETIWKTILALKRQGMYLEFVNYITKFKNYKEDLKNFCDTIIENFGSSIPLTLISFDKFFDYELRELKEIAESCGIRYVYVPEINEINTLCYNCKSLAIDRENKKILIKEDRCQNCGSKIEIIF